MKVKICGITTINEAKIMNEELPDFIGFVFAQSKRQVSIETAFEIKQILNPKIKTVGVFVDSPLDEILKYKKIIDIVQFHGDYTEDDIEKAAKEGFETIKVIKVQDKFYNINTKANYVLFDTFSKTQAGGLNKTFDWNVKIKSNVDFFIAGGLNSDNIKEAIEKLHPYAIDVSSGAEENGIKTKEKVSNIIKIARGIKYE